MALSDHKIIVMADKPPPAPDLAGRDRFERAVDVALHTASKLKESKGKGEAKPEPKPRS